ncbi:SRPBCC family protein [Halarchaeum sp. P4]|uniref:SRPBCC family protein n=1 Tax=Halarchaeum sp. P4 TaxID=3421639 RepID=UPI003EBDCDC1
MTTFEHDSWVRAPLEAVWAFHSRVEGLVALTPDWANLRVERVTGPDGGANPDVLGVGARLELSVRPFGVGPRQRVVSEITARERDDGTAFFRDVMVEGSFPEWEHTHLFYGEGDRTLCRDRIKYRTPTGPFSPVADEVARAGFEAAFRYRHRALRGHVE